MPGSRGEPGHVQNSRGTASGARPGPPTLPKMSSFHFPVVNSNVPSLPFSST